MINRYLFYLWDSAERDYRDLIVKLIREGNENTVLLDCGCDDGSFTTVIAKKIGTGHVKGIDVVPERLQSASAKGVEVYVSNLNEKFPMPDDSIDVLIANQVIEHLFDLDSFVQEIKRVLKPDGYCIICTENLASWHNIFSLLLGYQPFSLTNISSVTTIGNPMALHSGEKSALPLSWMHNKALAYNALSGLFSVHGFKVDKALGAGYYPFPPPISRFLSRLDKRHTAFIMIRAQKVSNTGD